MGASPSRRWDMQTNARGTSLTACLGARADRVAITACGVEVSRLAASPGRRLVIDVPPQASYRLTIEAQGVVHVSNHARGDTIDVSLDRDIVIAVLPETSFEHVSGRWQLVASPIPFGTREVGDDPAVRYLCLALLARASWATPLESIFVNSLSLALLTHFLKHYCPVPSARDEEPGIRLEPWQLRIAEETMLTHLDRRLPIAFVADRCGVSVVHFSRAFRRTTSETPHRWLMRRRLEKACTLLLNTDETIADIALTCGFSDQSHLTRTFSLLLGTTPASWRMSQRDPTEA